MSLEDWCDQRIEACPLFLFWSIILQLELEVMIYVRAIREGDFLLYIDALTKIKQHTCSLVLRLTRLMNRIMPL